MNWHFFRKCSHTDYVDRQGGMVWFRRVALDILCIDATQCSVNVVERMHNVTRTRTRTQHNLLFSLLSMRRKFCIGQLYSQIVSHTPHISRRALGGQFRRTHSGIFCISTLTYIFVLLSIFLFCLFGFHYLRCLVVLIGVFIGLLWRDANTLHSNLLHNVSVCVCGRCTKCLHLGSRICVESSTHGPQPHSFQLLIRVIHVKRNYTYFPLASTPAPTRKPSE